MSSNPAHGKVYSIQHYVAKFVSDLQQVGGFLWVLQLPPQIEGGVKNGSGQTQKAKDELHGTHKKRMNSGAR